MKIVELFRDYDYVAHPRRTIRFYGGVTYTRVIERAAQAIEQAGAGRIIISVAAGTSSDVKDASHAWRRRR
jgi:hypothetical protein